MPTETKFLGVYGAVWLAVLAAAATVLFARRMWQLLRILLLGRRENRFDHIGLRLATFVKEVLFQSRMLRGEAIINWAHPAIFWGFCLFVLASALLVRGRHRRTLDPHSPGGGNPAVGHAGRSVCRDRAGRPDRLFHPPLSSHPAGLATDGRRHDRRLAHRRADGHLPPGRGGRPREANDVFGSRPVGSDLAALRHALGTGPGGRGTIGRNHCPLGHRRLVGPRPDPLVLPRLPALFEAHAPALGAGGRLLCRAAAEGRAAAQKRRRRAAIGPKRPIPWPDSPGGCS